MTTNDAKDKAATPERVQFPIYLSSEELTAEDDGKQVGEVRTPDDKEVVADIVVDSKAIDIAKVKDAFTIYVDQLGHYLICFAMDTYKGIQKKDPEKLFVLYHEIGTIVTKNNDVIKDTVDTENYDAKAVELAEGLMNEINADHFAAMYLGKNIVITTLEKMRAEKKMEAMMAGKQGSPEVLGVLMEYDYRIQALKNS